ncbi:MAG TPA: chorismate mutase, partial [bacterium]|nr:chorismate mutase [bacterium]
MKSSKNDLKKIRDEIDRIDSKLVQLLNERAKSILKVKALKSKADMHFYAPHREREVYRRVARLNRGPLPIEVLNNIYCEIMSGSLALEAR